jgi:hypothetical protein
MDMDKVAPLPFGLTTISANTLMTMSTSEGVTYDKISMIIASYAQIKELHPVLKTLFDNQELKQSFFDNLKRDIGWIKGRSQNLRDHEITVYQKAFITMYEDRADRNNAGVLEMYMYEVLGFTKSATRQVMEKEIISFLGMKKALTEGKIGQLSDVDKCILTTEFTAGEATLTEKPEPVPGTIPPAQTLKASTAGTPKLDHLYNVYQDARIKFLTTTNKDSVKMYRIARFLYDTTENLIQFTIGKNIDKVIEDDLERTLKKAGEAMTANKGTKKRYFDPAEERRQEISIPPKGIVNPMAHVGKQQEEGQEAGRRFGSDAYQTSRKHRVKNKHTGQNKRDIGRPDLVGPGRRDVQKAGGRREKVRGAGSGDCSGDGRVARGDVGSFPKRYHLS